MDIHISNKSKATDKLDGEFHVPLSFGKGSNKNQWFCCIHCDKPIYLSVKTQGFICSKCDSYNGNIHLCVERFNELIEKGELFNEGNESTHVRSEETKKMISFRDSMNVKADLYAKGIRRNTVGSSNYNNMLNRALKENHVAPTKNKL